MSRPAPSPERPFLLIACGVLTLTGAFALPVSVIVGGLVVSGYDPVAETISDLGAGRFEIIVDIGLYLYAAGLIAAAIGAAHAHLGRLGWTLGIFSLAFIAAVVVIVGARNEYGDADSEGVVIHGYLVYALGLLFAAAPLLMAEGAGRAGAAYRVVFRLCAAVWIVAAPGFFLLPSSVDGLYERFLGLITLVWLSALAVLLVRRGRLTPGA